VIPTKEELEKAFVLGNISQDTYAQGINALSQQPQATEMPIQQQSQQMEPVQQQMPPENKRANQYNELMQLYKMQNPGMSDDQIESSLVLPVIEQQVKREESDILSKERSLKEDQKRQEELQKRRVSLGIEKPREPAQDGVIQPELEDNALTDSGQPQQSAIDMLGSLKASQQSPSMMMGGQGLSNMKSAYNELGNIQKEFSRVEAEYKEKEALNQQAQKLEMEKIQNQSKDADRLYEEYKNTSQIDPGRYWANADTSSKIGAMLSAAFGGYAQAYTGGRNIGMDMILDVANKDIEAQKSNAMLAKDKYESSRSLYDKMRQIYKDDQAAFAATKLATYDLIKTKYQMSDMKFKSAEAMAKLDAEMQKASVELEKKLGANASYNQAAYVIANSKNSKFDNVVNKDPSILADKLKNGKVEVMDIDGTPFVTENTQLAKETRNGLAARNKMFILLDEMKNIQTSGITDIEKKRMFTTLKGQLITAVKSQETLGALDKGLLEFADTLFAGIEYNNILSDTQKAIQYYKTNIDKKFKSDANSLYSGEEYRGKLEPSSGKSGKRGLI